MLCRYFQQGSCRFGDQCRYAHDGAPGKGAPPPPPGDDRPLCTYFLAGNCHFGESCRFSHGTGEGCWPHGKKGGKKGKKGYSPGHFWKGPKGQGSGKGKGDLDDWQVGKGPGPDHGAGGNRERALTGPYLGKGSELLKVWSMPEDMGHEDGVLAATVMADRVCTGGADHRLIVWRGEQPPEGGLAFVQDNEVELPAPVTKLLFHAASKWLFCGLGSGQIRAFRQEPFAELTLVGHTAAVTCLLIHEDVLMSTSLDGTIRAWKLDPNTAAFSCVATVPIELGEVFAIRSYDTGFWVGARRGIGCLGPQDLQPLGKIDYAAARVVALLPYQGRMLVAFADGVVKVYGSAGNEEFSHGPLGEHTTTTAAALLRHPHAGKDVLLCGQELGYVTAYEVPEFKPRGTFTTGYEGDVTAIVDMGADGIFATFGLTGDVVLWRWERNG